MWSAIRRILSAESHPVEESPSVQMTRACCEMLNGHGLSCRLENGCIVSEDGSLLAQARVFFLSPQGCHLDFEARDSMGNTILESCAGFGDSPGAQMREAMENFRNGSFHVIFSAFTGKPCSHSFEEEWEFADGNRKVFLSPVTCRGKIPESGEWLVNMQKAIEAMELTRTRHWIRLFHAQIPDGDPVNETLLDNEYCEPLQSQLADQPWVDTGSFYSVRFFMIIDP